MPKAEATEEKKKSDSPSSDVKPLPKSRRSARTDAAINGGHVGISGTLRGGTGNRLRHLEKTLRRPPKTPTELRDFLERATFLRDVTKATRNRFAQGGPPWTVLKPYLKSSGLDALIEKQQSAAGRMAALVPKSQTRFDPGAMEAMRGRVR